MAAALLLGCTITKLPGTPCTRSEPAVDPTAVTVSEADAVSLLTEFSPSWAIWEVSANVSESPAKVTIERTDEPTGTVSYEQQCGPSLTSSAGLLIPVNIVVALGDNDVTASFDSEMEAFAATLDGVFFGEGNGTPVLSTTWLEAAQADSSSEISWPPDSWDVELSGSLDGPRVSVDGIEGYDIGGYWDGTLTDTGAP